MVIKKIIMMLSVVGVANIAAMQSDCQPGVTTEECEYLSGSGNTYDGQLIDPATILKLLAQVSSKSQRGYAAHQYEHAQPVEPLSKEDRKKVEKFIKNNGLQELLSGAEYQHTFFCGTPEERGALKNKIDQELACKGITNLSRNSFVFEVPDTDLIIKKSMTFIARQNIVGTSERNKWEDRPAWKYGREVSEGEFCRWKQELGGHTYQNTSRAMVYLRALEASSVLETADLIGIPDTYLVHIPGRPKALDDTNYVVVERNFGERSDWQNSPLAIDEETILAMVKLTAATGFWTMASAASVVNDKLVLHPGKVVYHDLELPNDIDITKVLHKDLQHFRALVKIGWQELEDQIIKPYLEQHPEAQCEVEALLTKKRALQEEIMSCWTCKS